MKLDRKENISTVIVVAKLEENLKMYLLNATELQQSKIQYYHSSSNFDVFLSKAI